MKKGKLHDSENLAVAQLCRCKGCRAYKKVIKIIEKNVYGVPSK